MNIQDAFSLLSIDQQPIDQAAIKKAYKIAAFKFHPDRNAAGLEMMQMINTAYAYLKTVTDFSSASPAADNYPEAVSDAINAVIGLQGLTVEICGNWVWLSGDTKPHKDAIKAAGFRWASKKRMWYFRPAQYKSKNRRQNSMADIRNMHGSRVVTPKQRKAVK